MAGEADAAFASFFGLNGEAAVLACDELGMWPDELLHLPKAIFQLASDGPDQARLRYTMRERARQQALRKLLAIKAEKIAAALAGRAKPIEVQWAERCALMPDAPMVPQLGIPPAAIAAMSSAALDTESDDDGLDEYFRPKPPAPPPAPAQASASPRMAQRQSRDGGPLSSPNTATFAPLSPSKAAQQGFFGDQQQQSQRSPRLPSPPRMPPLPRRTTPRALEREEVLLSVASRRLARFGANVTRHAAAVAEAEHAAAVVAVPAPARPGTAATTTASGGLSARDRAAAVLAAPSPPRERYLPTKSIDESRRQLDAMLRTTMVGIARSAIAYKTWREEAVLSEEELRERARALFARRLAAQATPGAVRGTAASLRASPQELWVEQEVLRQAREEERRDEDAARAAAVEQRLAEKRERAALAAERRRHRHDLDFEKRRVLQELAAERRGNNERARHVHTARDVDHAEARRAHAAMTLEQRQLAARVAREQHVQLQLVRRGLRESFAQMSQRNTWEVPPIASEILTMLHGGEEGLIAANADGTMVALDNGPVIAPAPPQQRDSSAHRSSSSSFARR